MATTSAPKLDEEFEQFMTRDPEAFFETMLISIRGASQDRIANRRIDFEKLVFKQWFRRYEKELYHEVERDSALLAEKYNEGLQAGKLRILRHILGERWRFITPKRLRAYLRAVEEERL